MKAKTPFYGDRIDRKAKIAQRLYRNEKRTRDVPKYNVIDEDEDLPDHIAKTGEMPLTKQKGN